VFHFPTFFSVLWIASSRRYLTVRYAFAISLIMTWLLSFLIIVRSLQLLDLVLFPRYRRAKIEAPVFIIANPRSGTTFLHRIMCLDE
jgi:hypothetical protein